MRAKMGGPSPSTMVPETVVASRAFASPSNGSRPATASTTMMMRPIVRCLDRHHCAHSGSSVEQAFGQSRGKKCIYQRAKSDQILAVWGGLGVPSSSRPANSGPSSLAALVNVESSVLSDSKINMMLVIEYSPAHIHHKCIPRILWHSRTALGDKTHGMMSSCCSQLASPLPMEAVTAGGNPPNTPLYRFSGILGSRQQPWICTA
jgi:hypothetical protein